MSQPVDSHLNFGAGREVFRELSSPETVVELEIVSAIPVVIVAFFQMKQPSRDAAASQQTNRVQTPRSTFRAALSMPKGVA